MALAIFDLDNTLLNGDSDYLWGQFLAENNYVDPIKYQQTNQAFYDQYVAGTMDITDFLAFQLTPLASHSMDDLFRWRDTFLLEKITPIILPAAQALIEQHRRQGDTLLIITATNSFITQPIAEIFGIAQLIATEPEIVDGRYTGKVVGIPSYKEGKVERLQQWLKDQQQSLEGSYFYSDSHNDLPLLNVVTYPIVVDPDSTLRTIAQQRGWKILSLRK